MKKNIFSFLFVSGTPGENVYDDVPKYMPKFQLDRKDMQNPY
jgi:hypothetical protein